MRSIGGTVEDKMGKTLTKMRLHKTEDSDVLFMRLLNILHKLAQSYYTHKPLSRTVSVINFLYSYVKCEASFVILSLFMICDDLRRNLSKAISTTYTVLSPVLDLIIFAGYRK